MVARSLLIRCLPFATVVCVFCAGTSRAVDPVYVEILGDQHRNSPDPLEPFDIRFIVHANGNRIQGIVFVGQFVFSNGNIIGEIEEWPNGDAQVLYSPQALATFNSRSWNSSYAQGSSPDTMLLGLTSFHEPWAGTGEMFRIRVHPKDTGSVVFDSLPWPIVPTYYKIEAYDPNGAIVEPLFVWNPAIHVPPRPGPVRFRISTSSGTDTLFFGVPGTIYFNVDAMGNEIAGLVFGLKWDFTNGSFIGRFSDVTGEVQYSTTALDTYESIGFNSNYAQGTDPDTSLLVLTDFGGTRFSGSDWIWSVTFQPLDTGTVVIDSDFMHPPAWTNIEAMDPVGFDLPANFIPGRIAVVPCPYTLMGDVNQDAVITSADLIYFINYVFKSGPDPLPDRSIGDVNCSGGLGASDIIYLVNYIFKSGAPPCACIVRRI